MSKASGDIGRLLGGKGGAGGEGNAGGKQDAGGEDAGAGGEAGGETEGGEEGATLLAVRSGAGTGTGHAAAAGRAATDSMAHVDTGESIGSSSG